MIDGITIFTKGGVVLWSYYFIKLKECPIQRLVQDVLLEERGGGDSCAFLDPFNVRWALVNELDLVIVIFYEGIHQSVFFIDTLLQMVKAEFILRLKGHKKPCTSRIEFDVEFHRILQKCEKLSQVQKRPTMRGFTPNQKPNKPSKKSSTNGKQNLEGSDDESSAGGALEKHVDHLNSDKVAATHDKDTDNQSNGEGEAGNDEPSPYAQARQRLMLRGNHPPKMPKTASMGVKKSKKQMQSWGTQKVTKQSMTALDFSNSKDDEGHRCLDAYQGESEDEERVSDQDSSGQSHDADSKPRGLFGRLAAAVQNITGNKTLTYEDLDIILTRLKMTLMEKNVAAEIAERLTASVKASLIGVTTERFTSIQTTAKKALAEAVERILTPKKSVDVLHAALEAKSRGKVYSICFLGVNGVGKSTSLAKVCHYLKHKGGLNVMIAACDTFRAGAVEQLRTHARCLDVYLYEKGYGKDAAMVAKDALAFARTHKYDVVLIDTAGRMQDNEPLMRSLAKLVAVNSPDLVLFVGEALVGNDAVDQLDKFNKSLIDMSMHASPRGIDGILLTKFDTVDDKVGAAISMVYLSGQPVIFVGTGQKYTHLRQLNVATVVKHLVD